jgi:hypothetical protein
VEDPLLESSESGEEGEGIPDPQLDEATFEPDETVERRGDFEMSEAIESGFAQLMDASDLFTGDSLEIDPDAGGDESIDHLTIALVSKIDSFTWKLQVAEDEVGSFRIPSLHDTPIVDVPDPGTPNPTGEPIELVQTETGSDEGKQEPGSYPRDVTEMAQLVMGMAMEDMDQDIKDYEAKQEAMNEAKQKIRDQLGSFDNTELDIDPQTDLGAPGSLVSETGQAEETTETQVRYGEAKSEPKDRADASSAEADEEEATPPEPEQESSNDKERD